jgi:hypothetical protein
MPSISELCIEPLYLCGKESSQVPLPGSWISAKYLFFKKFKAFNTLLNSNELTKRMERVFLLLKILLGHSNRWTQCNHHEPSYCVFAS